MEELINKCKNSNNINFLPYIGKEYISSDLKILVLGESHYGPQKNNADRTLTNQVVRDEYLRDRSKGIKNVWTKCYRNVAAMITGEGFYKSDYIWDNMSFYNFFQEVVGESAKDKKFINEELIFKSRQAFIEIIDILKPDVIIAWGLGHLKNKWLPLEGREKIVYDNLFIYKQYNNTPVWCINHPSNAFSYNKHHEHWKEVCEKLGLK